VPLPVLPADVVVVVVKPLDVVVLPTAVVLAPLPVVLVAAPVPLPVQRPVPTMDARNVAQLASFAAVSVGAH
jgi:hypothetical protein